MKLKRWKLTNYEVSQRALKFARTNFPENHWYVDINPAGIFIVKGLFHENKS